MTGPSFARGWVWVVAVAREEPAMSTSFDRDADAIAGRIGDAATGCYIGDDHTPVRNDVAGDVFSGGDADAAAIHGADLTREIPVAGAHAAQSDYVYVAATRGANGPAVDRHIVAGPETDGAVRDQERPVAQEIDVANAGSNDGVRPKDRRAGGQVDRPAGVGDDRHAIIDHHIVSRLNREPPAGSAGWQGWQVQGPAGEDNVAGGLQDNIGLAGIGRKRVHRQIAVDDRRLGGGGGGEGDEKKSTAQAHVNKMTLLYQHTKEDVKRCEVTLRLHPACGAG